MKFTSALRLVILRAAAVVPVLALFACKTGTGNESPQVSTVLEAGSATLFVCTGARPFFGESASAFDFNARDASMSNAYWLAALASHAYSQKDVVIEELKRLGFKDSPDAASANHLFFLDEDGVARNLLKTSYNFRWASTQAFWAENESGVILSFRGTNPTELGDLVTDIWTAQSSLNAAGSEKIGKTTEPSGGETDDIFVHRGFWRALDIVWKPIEARLKTMTVGGPGNKIQNMKTLDDLAAKLASGDQVTLTNALGALPEWKVELDGKRNFVKTWLSFKNDADKRGKFYDFLAPNWSAPMKPIFITGHSLGGALATLAAYRMMKMGANVRGLYTFGSPRTGNRAFQHDFRVLAFDHGLKGQGKEGGLARFVDHNDIVARIPPGLGWSSAFDDSSVNPFLDKWQHITTMHYLTGADSSDTELWVEGDKNFDDKFAETPVPQYTAKMPLEAWKQWVGDHNVALYAHKIEKIAFGTETGCN